MSLMGFVPMHQAGDFVKKEYEKYVRVRQEQYEEWQHSNDDNPSQKRFYSFKDIFPFKEYEKMYSSLPIPDKVDPLYIQSMLLHEPQLSMKLLSNSGGQVFSQISSCAGSLVSPMMQPIYSQIVEDQRLEYDFSDYMSNMLQDPQNTSPIFQKFPTARRR
ncbi:hypothetical protein FGO68_gene9477 [Halteria grandinella]|uniref:Uncharacterized protein n=1 Tax=Halteria grandinella TaxID=5974 RepID=A0A8J8NVJ0_HALGN|nr:hypothetical protein FGO68_gene9477 [Halteria grandinella]